MAKEIWKGDYAYAETALRAGCNFYSGYPITPASELMEYMSVHMPEYGGVFIQADNEANIGAMLYGAGAAGAYAMTASSAPGGTLLQESMSWASKYDLPFVVVQAQRYGGGTSTQRSDGQTDYKRDTNSGGQGDYRSIVYGPGSVQETCDLLYNAWDKAFRYRCTVVMHIGRNLAQLSEAVELPPRKERKPAPAWCLNGTYHTYDPALGPDDPRGYAPEHLESLVNDPEKYLAFDKARWDAIIENEQMWDAGGLEDADYVLVGYGLPGRAVKKTALDLRAAGEKVGYIRPVTLWPFPQKAFDQISPHVKGIITYEVNTTGQMKFDVAVAIKRAIPQRNVPVYAYYYGVPFGVEKMNTVYRSVISGEMKPEL